MVKRVARLFKPYRGQVGLVFASILVTGALGVAPAFITKAIINRALLPHDLHLLWRLVALMIAIPLVSGAIGVGQTYLTTVVGQRVMQDLRNRLYEHLQAMSLRFFTGARTGDLQSRLQNDVGGVQSVVTNTASSVLSNVVTVLSTVVAMLLLSWQLTALSFAVVPVFVYLTWRVGRARRQLSKETQESLAELSTLTEETLSVSGVLLAKTFDRQRDAIARYREGNRRLAWLQVRQQMVGRSFFALVQVFFSASPALIFLVAGYSHLSLGTIVAFTTLQTRLLFPIGNMLQTSVEVQSSLALFERIFAYLDLPQDIVDAPGARELPKDRVRGRVELDEVYFRYEEPVRPAALEAQAVEVDGDGSRPVAPREWTLEDITLEIEPGQLAAIVGPSGAGKTTISYLVPRLYDVTRGHVRIDGIDVRDIKLASLAEIVGMVTQETYLFHSSVRENLLYAKPDASQEEIEAATRAAAIHERITELSEGYDTLVGERGYRMSGGEKQRLAIARVILKDPRILILDEATSALDTTSERLVQHALEPLMEERTTIAIAHRLSTILAADMIFVVDRGRLREQGTHDELLRQGGLYAELYVQQFQGGLVEARCEDGVVLASGEVLTTAGVS
ncbi:MAG: ABC transporter ATP-binding protein [Actinobacteria bacterium]|nr:MAG: ABC transporter ATP-binding protein [Actinomycetota bacterium]